MYIPNMMKAMKGVSARLLMKEFGSSLKKKLLGGHLWNPSYFVATVSENTEEQIRNYIQNQKRKWGGTVEKAYKYRIYPNKEQRVLIAKTFGCCRYVYNYYLDKRIEWYQTSKKTFSYNKCSADLTQLKSERKWLREVDSTALQSSLRHLDDAYKEFHKWLYE